MSVCADETKDHLCDICSIALSYCIDENENYVDVTNLDDIGTLTFMVK
jgi:hypothetical protein